MKFGSRIRPREFPCMQGSLTGTVARAPSDKAIWSSGRHPIRDPRAQLDLKSNLCLEKGLLLSGMASVSFDEVPTSRLRHTTNSPICKFRQHAKSWWVCSPTFPSSSSLSSHSLTLCFFLFLRFCWGLLACEARCLLVPETNLGSACKGSPLAQSALSIALSFRNLPQGLNMELNSADAPELITYERIAESTDFVACRRRQCRGHHVHPTRAAHRGKLNDRAFRRRN